MVDLGVDKIFHFRGRYGFISKVSQRVVVENWKSFLCATLLVKAKLLKCGFQMQEKISVLLSQLGALAYYSSLRQLLA